MQEIIFEVDTQYGLYRDALYFPDGEPLPPESVLDEMKLERVNNWIEFIENPPPPPPESELTDG